MISKKYKLVVLGHTFYSWSTFIVMEAGFLLYVLSSAWISWYIFSTLFTIFWPIKSTLYSVFYIFNLSFFGNLMRHIATFKSPFHCVCDDMMIWWCNAEACKLAPVSRIAWWWSNGFLERRIRAHPSFCNM